jgi:iron(III) transport system permease protein
VDSRTLSLLLNTFYLAGATCAASLPVGILLAGVLWKTDCPGRNFFRAVLTAMLFVPLYLQTAAWQAGFWTQGWCTAMTGLPPLVEGWRGAIWIHAAAALPWVAMIVGLGLRRSERELEEAALLDASAGKVFFRVTLKNALPAVAAAALWTAVTTAGEMTVTDFFGIRTYAEEIYTQVAIAQDPAELLGSVAIGCALTILLILAGVRLLYFFLPRERSLSLSPSLTFPLGRLRWPAFFLVGGFMLLFVGVPAGGLIFNAGKVVVQTDAGLERSFSVQQCCSMIAHSPIRYSREFGWSLLIGTVSASATVIVGTLFAWWCRNFSPSRASCEVEPRGQRVPRRSLGTRFSFAILLFIAILFSLPGPVLGFGVIGLLNRPETPPLYWLYDHSILAPCLVLILKSLPAATLVMWHAMHSIPREVLECAAVDGAGSWMQLFRIALPMRWTAVAAAWLIALAVSLGDLSAVILVLPPDVYLLSTSIFNLLHYGVDDRAAGLCLSMLLIFTLLAAAVLLITRRMAKSR